MAEFKPHISPESDLKDFSVKALLVGAVFGVLFGSANAYLGLRVGLTISKTIPTVFCPVPFATGRSYQTKVS